MWNLNWLLWCLLFLKSANSWDLAVTTEDENGIQFYTYTKNGNIKEWEYKELPNITALHYEPIFNVMFMVQNHHSIYYLDLDSRDNKEVQVLDNPDGQINDLTFDPVTKKVFWTDWVENGESKIGWKSVEDESRGYVTKLTEKPWGIAVDSCLGHVYWSTDFKNGSKSIERSNFNGSEFKIVYMEKGLPGICGIGLYMSLKQQKLYIANDMLGFNYEIDRYDLNNGDFNTIYKNVHIIPTSIAVDDNFIYWTDSTDEKTVTTLSMKDNNTAEIKINAAKLTTKGGRLERIPNSKCEKWNALVGSNATLTRLVSRQPVEDIDIPKKQSSEVSLCNNYCLNDGKCRIVVNKPECFGCKLGFEGVRCEIQKCHNLCVQGTCELDSMGEPSCRCWEGFSGERCENNTSILNLLETSLSSPKSQEPYWMYAFAVLASISGIMTLACVALTVKYLNLRKRPKIKKRIIVNRNVTPLTDARPDQQHCEITIENCCNMNICETPCFEPRSFRGSSKDRTKEEKRNLILNMENPDDI